MKISLNWLSDYIKLNETPEDIAEALTMGIAEVEGIKKNKNIKGIVIGEVVEIKKHPNADKLSLALVDIGKKKMEIICGAQNLTEGQKVPVATLGTELPNGLEIKKVKIRGIASQGMICSEQELGLADKSEGIMVLSSKAKAGTDFAEFIEWEDDAIFEIDNKSLTHRSDLFGHIGIARELSAIFNKKINIPVCNIDKNLSDGIIDVEVKDKKACPRYMAVILDNIKIMESPKWMQMRLLSCGVRPINNVVDITNYVLLEYGQPLHAFDYNKLDGDNKKNIIVRFGKNGEKLTTLDKKERELSNKDLVIADNKNAIALAGVMGGLNTEVDEKTTKIILESANFDSYTIRKTAQRLSLRTEAVTRFEKGLSPYFAGEAMSRAISFLTKYADAKIASKITDTQSKASEEKEVILDHDKLNQYIGQEIKLEKVVKILTNLDFKVSGSKKIKAKIPLYRMDISIEEDLIEEVARIYGYDNIKPQKLYGVIEPTKQDKEIFWGNKMVEILAGMGMSEVMNYSFCGDKLLQRALLTNKDHIELENPISKDLKYLRTTLLPGLFDAAEKNILSNEEIKIFELGHVYFEDCECKSLSGIIVGGKDDVFYQVKGVVENLLKNLNIKYQPKSLDRDMSCEYFNMYDEAGILEYSSGKELLGTISLLDKRVIDNFSLKNKSAAFFNLSVEKISKLSSGDIKFIPLPKYPPVMLDIAFVIKEEYKAKEIEKEIYKSGQPLLENIELFDVYSGKQVGEGKKSLAYHLKYRSSQKTLTEDEVGKIHVRVLNSLKQKFQAKLRY